MPFSLQEANRRTDQVTLLLFQSTPNQSIPEGLGLGRIGLQAALKRLIVVVCMRDDRSEHQHSPIGLRAFDGVAFLRLAGNLVNAWLHQNPRVLDGESRQSQLCQCDCEGASASWIFPSFLHQTQSWPEPTGRF